MQLSRSASPPSRACPVMNVTRVAMPRCVSGIPSSALIPDAAVTPAAAEFLSTLLLAEGLGCQIHRKTQKWTWYAVHLHALLLQVLHLLATSPKYIRVTTLEPQRPRTLLRKLAQQLVDFCLRPRMEALVLADVYHDGATMDKIQNLWRDKPVRGAVMYMSAAAGQ